MISGIFGGVAILLMLLSATPQVISVIFGGIAMLLMFLSVAATTWLEANSVREGLWEKCRYRANDTDSVDCQINLPRGKPESRARVNRLRSAYTGMKIRNRSEVPAVFLFDRL